MNFSVHMDEKTVKELTSTALAEGKSRSALLTEAFKQYVQQKRILDQNNGWPQTLIAHLRGEGAYDAHDFDSTSDMLPMKDPVL